MSLTYLDQLQTFSSLLSSDKLVTLRGTGLSSEGLVSVSATSLMGAAVITLTYASTVNTNVSLGNVFNLTLTGNVILANPTNGVDGQSIRWRIRQDGTGSRTVTLGNKFRIPSSATTPLLWSITPLAVDIFAAMYNSTDDKWDVVSMVPGYLN